MLGHRLRDLREELDKNQTQVARELIMSQSAYSLYERGKRSPDYETLKKLANYYNVSMAYLLGETDEKNIQSNTPVIEATPAAIDSNVINIKALSSLERHLFKAYLELDYDVRQKFVEHFKIAFSQYEADITKQNEIDTKVERYRLELEAERYGKKGVSGSSKKNLG